jgi:hypothetical protein
VERRVREIEQSNDSLNIPENQSDLGRFRATRVIERLTDS